MRLMRFRRDVEPNVATSLPLPSVQGKERLDAFLTYHTVATPYLRDVSTTRVSSAIAVRSSGLELTFMTVEHIVDTCYMERMLVRA